MVAVQISISQRSQEDCVLPASPHAFSEARLVEAAKTGQSAAFTALCERHTQQLVSTALRITRNLEDAEDAVQDALLSAFVHIGRFDGRSSFLTWLTRIAINSSLMILRKKRSSREVAIVSADDSGADGLCLEIVDHAPNPERLYAQSERERILHQAVFRLRPTLRQVVEIQQLQERSLRETAKAMRISVAAAKARLFHAKSALRRSSILRLMQQPGTRGKFLPAA
jgi:RNA polymerase sigma-70 factor (ECF subfamily)